MFRRLRIGLASVIFRRTCEHPESEWLIQWLDKTDGDKFYVAWCGNCGDRVK